MTGASMGAHFSAFVSRGLSNQLVGYGYESARSALFAVLSTRRPTRLYLPSFRCSALSEAAQAANVPVIDFAISSRFEPILEEGPGPDDLILLTDYFGLCASGVERQVQRFGPSQVVVDRAHAWFARPANALATIYSPRKFLPVADGGLVVTSLNLQVDAPDEIAAKRRYRYLIDRVGEEPEATRSAYLDSENSLSAIGLRGISSFTIQAIENQPAGIIRERRIANFDLLHALLCEVNELDLERADQVPLCYPLLIANGEAIRERLLTHRIFVPRFWPGAVPGSSFEESLSRSGLFLPIDHRYGSEEMTLLAEWITRELRGLS